MTNVSSRRLLDSLPEIGAHLARAPAVLLGLDFDGTLTPIVEHPARAVLAPRVSRLLLSLAGRQQISLAVISGRALADLKGLVGIQTLIYAGNHGLEIAGPDFSFVEPAAAASRPALQELAQELARRLQPLAGAFVEDKELTLTVHFRQVASEDLEEFRRIVHAVLAGSSHPFVLTTGHKSYELRPRVYWNKGQALRWIKEQLGQSDPLTVYFGDDATDEDVFTAFPEGITGKVGSGAETAAHYLLDGPADVLEFLSWLANRVR
jgi:trehalose-phosphatase